MVFVIGKHRMDISRPLRFCGRHKIALLVLAMVIVLSMSASVCALQSGAFDPRPETASASGEHGITGGRCPVPHRDIVYSPRYNYARFNACDWYMVFMFTDVTAHMTPDEAAAVDAWTLRFEQTHDGWVRFPAYKKLWSRSAIGQPI